MQTCTLLVLQQCTQKTKYVDVKRTPHGFFFFAELQVGLFFRNGTLFNDWDVAIDLHALADLIESQKNSWSIIGLVCALAKEEIEIEKLTKRPLQIRSNGSLFND